ncbi:ADP-ribosylglycohydrolase family protein [bacterium]|nr:ADP-ribosylglycohydrolase family protein [bacterium]
MKKTWTVGLLLIVMLAPVLRSETVNISKAVLKDKIKGGWAGQAIGCTYGGPTEFRYNGTLIQDYIPITWYDGYIKWWYDNAPGLYDDIYMDLTFVEVFEKKGLDAPAGEFAKAFAHAEYPLWHANQAARYNILRGLQPPDSGHWVNNPHADDIDYQIEADFSGLMSPGMPNTSAEISDKIGHIMNSGDGWYGGVFVGAMYSLAFVYDDVETVVTEALKTIPEQSRFAMVVSDAINAYKDNPRNWKFAWGQIQTEWSEDIGCPNGVFKPWNIDASINSAWVVIGLLYGEMDFGKTVDISTRCGDDSDCNPATAGGILGTMIGYDAIPKYWKMGLAEVEPIDFKYTEISLNDAYELSYKHALKVIQRHGGSIADETATIQVQKPKPVKLEKNFEGHFPIERKRVKAEFTKEFAFDFEGVGFVVDGGSVRKQGASDVVLEVDMQIDGKTVETTKLPSNRVIRKNTLFWRYQLPMGLHKVKLVVKNPTKKARIQFDEIIIYGDKPVGSEWK